jgi:PII-like signaling protein
MLLRQPAKLLRLHFEEADRHQGAALHEAIVKTCLDLGIAGVTVFRGAEAHHHPLVVNIIDTAENIEKLMPALELMVDTGTIAVSDVEMIRVRN